MNETELEMHKRVLNILHLGFVEIRNLALAAGQSQIADLADAMEIIPVLIDRNGEEDLQMIDYVLKNYQDEYPSFYDFLRLFRQAEAVEMA